MRIAILANLDSSEDGPGLRLMQELAQAQTGHDFLFLADPYTRIIEAPQITVVRKAVQNKLVHQRWWLDLGLPRLLKKWKADVLVCLGGHCSLGTRIPQIMEVPGLLSRHQPQLFDFSARSARQFFLPKYLAKASAVFSYSNAVAEELAQVRPDCASKMFTVLPGAEPFFHPLDWQEADAVKDGFADGREYFLFPGGLAPENNLMNVLKAFSRFKTWQHSNMKLLVSGNLDKYPGMKERLSRYKFREDVVLLDEVTRAQLAKIFASAYAVVYPPLYTGNGQIIAEAMQAGTAVITSTPGAAAEYGGESVLIVDPNDETAIAAEMIRLYKDEALRSRLIGSGLQRAAGFAAQPATATLWDRIATIAPAK